MKICSSQNRNQLCFILGFVSLLSPIDLLQGLKTENAYNMKVCPLNKKEWQKASQRLNCTDDVENPVNRYHCLPVDDLTTLVEFCYNQTRPRIVKGLCMVYVQGIKTLNYYNCSNFKEGCPDTNYFSDESYEFSRCIQIDPTRRCYLAEPSCRPDTHKSDDDGVHVAWFISSAAVIVAIVIAIAAYYKWIRRSAQNGKEINTGTKEELKNLADDPESLKQMGWHRLTSILPEQDIVLSDIDGKPVQEVTHISRVTSEILWMENEFWVLKINHSGKILFNHKIGVFWGCSSFTVDENEDVLYIKDYRKVIWMKSTGENHKLLFEVSDESKIINICSAKLRGEIILRVYFQDKNKHQTFIKRYNKNGEQLFQFMYGEYDNLHSSPWFISVNVNGNICISDHLNHQVRSFDEYGNLLYVYEGHASHTFNPTGISNDLLGHVLVCNESYPSVHLLDINGKFLTMIIRDREDVKDPWGLCTDDNGKLYIGQKNCNVIKVFQYLKKN